MAFEIIENPRAASPMGSFKPHAPQDKFRSVFACVGGVKKSGWFDEHLVRQGITTQDGRAKIAFDEFKDEKNKAHTIRHDGMELREFVVPVEEALEKEKYDGLLSTGKVNTYLKARGTNATEEMPIGLTTGGSQTNLEQTIPAIN